MPVTSSGMAQDVPFLQLTRRSSGHDFGPQMKP